MRNLLKLKVIFLIFTIIFTSHSIAADQILPLPKPKPISPVKKKAGGEVRGMGAAIKGGNFTRNG